MVLIPRCSAAGYFIYGNENLYYFLLEMFSEKLLNESSPSFQAFPEHIFRNTGKDTPEKRKHLTGMGKYIING